jgi:hypothetical protein
MAAMTPPTGPPKLKAAPVPSAPNPLRTVGASTFIAAVPAAKPAAFATSSFSTISITCFVDVLYQHYVKAPCRDRNTRRSSESNTPIRRREKRGSEPDIYKSAL